MKQVLIQGGRVVVHDMPAPPCGDGEVLVRAAYSLISTGTETTTLAASSVIPSGAWGRRLSKVGEVIGLIRERGLSAARGAVADRLRGPCQETGYSLAGTVIEVGSGVHDLVPGQRVACAGAASAHHAEIVAVPRNLVVPVPDDLCLAHASFVTLGAIALQGVRQADLRLGEIAYVAGLGLLGQLSVSLLAAAGCRVWGADLERERVERARAAGLELGLVAGQDDVEREVQQASAGRGVDAVLLTASTSSSEPLRQAMRLVRRRGRVVVVGSVGLELERHDFYMKEAELRISSSYGPGRYDPDYEERGRDYPYGFVRWTENRNMEEFLRLAASGSVPLDALAGVSLPVEQAGEAFRRLSDGPRAARPLAVLLHYPGALDTAGPRPTERSVRVVPPPRRETLGVALVGPGSFAGEVHVPNLARLGPSISLHAVVGRSGNTARELARRWSANLATTALDEALCDPAVDLVLICTRHHLHAAQAARSLEAGKAVFLEKPAALDPEQLERLTQAVGQNRGPFVLGLNRRFAPDVIALRALLARRRGPLVATYRVNAGRLPADHWALGPEGGGRLLGEACHMVDLLDHLAGNPRSAHQLQVLAPGPGRPDLPRGDNFTLETRYADGSLATLVYLSVGHPQVGKERLEVHWDGNSALLEDFRGLSVNDRPVVAPRSTPDKGHLELLRRFVDHAAGRSPVPPIPAQEILDNARFMLRLDRESRGER